MSLVTAIVVAACDGRGGESRGAGGVAPESLRATVSQHDVTLADPESTFHRLHAFPGVPRVWVEMIVQDSYRRVAVLEVDLLDGGVRRLSPDPRVVADLSSEAWRRAAGAVVVRADGAPIVVESSSIVRWPAPDLMIVPAAPARLPDRESRERYGGVDDWAVHVGNVHDRNRRSPDGRYMLVALVDEPFASPAPIRVLDLETGDVLEADPRLAEAFALGLDQHRVDVCFWEDETTFTLALWRYEGDLGRRWIRGSVRDGRVAIDAHPAPWERPGREVQGVIAGRAVTRGVARPDGTMGPGVMVGPWEIVKSGDDGFEWSPVLRGTGRDTGLFETRAIGAGSERGGRGLLVVRVEPTESDGRAPEGDRPVTEWIELDAVDASGRWSDPEAGWLLQDAVPDPRSEAGEDDWLLLHEREGLLSLTRGEDGSWSVTPVATRRAAEVPAGTGGSAGQ